MSKRVSGIRNILGLGFIVLATALPLKAEEKSAATHTTKPLAIEQNIGYSDLSEKNPETRIKNPFFSLGYEIKGKDKTIIDLQTQAFNSSLNLEHEIKQNENKEIVNFFRGYLKKDSGKSNLELEINSNETAKAKYQTQLNKTQKIKGSVNIGQNKNLETKLGFINKGNFYIEACSRLGENPEFLGLNTSIKTAIADFDLGYKNNTYSAKIIRNFGNIRIAPELIYNESTKNSFLTTELQLNLYGKNKGFSAKLENKMQSGKKSVQSGEVLYKSEF